MYQREVAVFEALQVAQHLGFRAVLVEDGMREEVGGARHCALVCAVGIPRVTSSEELDEVAQVTRRHRLIQRDTYGAVAEIAEVDAEV